MIHLITGGSASGKSSYAEQLAVSLDADIRFYIATMRPWGEEGRLRVEKHRAMRAGKGFETIECYHHLAEVRLDAGGPLPGGGYEKDRVVVLLECMSNLTANEQFEAGGTDEEIMERILGGIRHLQKQAGHIIIVTNEVFSDGGKYDEETVRYLALLGQINRKLAAMAGRVTEVVYGIPVPVRKNDSTRSGAQDGGTVSDVWEGGIESGAQDGGTDLADVTGGSMEAGITIDAEI